MSIITRFRCIRCKQQYATVAKLMAHNCDDKSVTGILATLEQFDRDAPINVRAPLATKAASKPAVPTII